MSVLGCNRPCSPRGADTHTLCCSEHVVRYIPLFGCNQMVRGSLQDTQYKVNAMTTDQRCGARASF